MIIFNKKFQKHRGIFPLCETDNAVGSLRKERSVSIPSSIYGKSLTTVQNPITVRHRNRYSVSRTKFQHPYQVNR